jgi:protein-tyrosine phosphatase
VIDLHSHVLPGVDDGPATIADSLAIAQAAAAAGTRILVATPHVSYRYPNDPGTIARSVEEANGRLSEAGVALAVRRGGEIAMDYLAEIGPTELPLLCFGKGPWLLIEPPFTSVLRGLDLVVENLQRRGYRIVLAHPERCYALHRNPLLLGSLVRGGVLTSITAGSLIGRFGEHIRRFTLQLAHDGLIHNVASDAHDIVKRPPGMAVEIERAGLGPLMEWLTEEVPAAILDGERTIPPRPAVALRGLGASRRRWWRRVRGLTRAS